MNTGLIHVCPPVEAGLDMRVPPTAARAEVEAAIFERFAPKGSGVTAEFVVRSEEAAVGAPVTSTDIHANPWWGYVRAGIFNLKP